MAVGADERAHPAQSHAHLMHALCVGRLECRRLAASELRETSPGNDAEGRARRHVARESDRLRAYRLGRPALEEAVAARRFRAPFDSQRQTSGKLERGLMQAARTAAFEFELDLRDREAAIARANLALVQRQLDERARMAEGPGGAPDFGDEHRLKPFSDLALRKLAMQILVFDEQQIELVVRQLDFELAMALRRAAAFRYGSLDGLH